MPAETFCWFSPGPTEIGGWASAPRLPRRDPARAARVSPSLGAERANAQAGRTAAPVRENRAAAFPPEGFQSPAPCGLGRS